MTEDKSFYDRDAYVAKWAKMFKCKADVWSVGCALINDVKNYDSAMALIFGLSWRHNKEWLRRASDYFRNYWKSLGDKAVASPDWLYQYQQHYLNSVDKYPS
jgi:hypothetical protein